MDKGIILENPNKKILVVDDDPEITMIIRDILESQHYKVFCAKDGPHAVQKADEKKVDLILLDIQMPSLSGFWFCDLFKKKPSTKNIPVVMVSALSDEKDIRKARELGAAGYLKKPFQASDLLATVEKALA